MPSSRPRKRLAVSGLAVQIGSSILDKLLPARSKVRAVEHHAGARWNEIDLLDKTWTLAAARMKAHREHGVPLSARALTILEEMPLLMLLPPKSRLDRIR
jgi:hypothetical protein